MTATLTYQSGGTIYGTALAPPPNWGFIFFDLLPGSATLSIFSSTDTQPTTEQVSIASAAAVVINYPPDGSQVPSTFIAWGTKDQKEDSVQGSLTQNPSPGNSTSPGRPSPAVDMGAVAFDRANLLASGQTLWAIRFSNIPPGSYKLTVWTPQSSQSVNIQV
jgi:hypothetical protein